MNPETVLVTAGTAYAVISLDTLLVPSVRNLRRRDDKATEADTTTGAPEGEHSTVDDTL